MSWSLGLRPVDATPNVPTHIAVPMRIIET